VGNVLLRNVEDSNFKKYTIVEDIRCVSAIETPGYVLSKNVFQI
jgi:hypothetical protein